MKRYLSFIVLWLMLMSCEDNMIGNKKDNTSSSPRDTGAGNC